MMHKLILYFVLLALAALFFYSYSDEFFALSIVRPIYLGPLGLVLLLFFLMNGLYNRYFFRIYGKDLTFKEWFGLSILNSFGNLVAPMRAGAVSNALYLKRCHGLEYQKFMGVLSALYVIVFWVNSLVGLVSLAFVDGGKSQLWWVMLAFFGGSFGFFSVVLLLTPTFPQTRWRLVNLFFDALNSFSELRGNPKVLFQLVCVTFANVVLMSLATVFQLRALGLDILLFESALIAVFSSFSLFVSITPGNLGIREAFASFSGLVAGVSPTVIVAGSVLERMLTFVLGFPLAWYFSVKLMKAIQDSPSD